MEIVLRRCWSPRREDAMIAALDVHRDVRQVVETCMISITPATFQSQQRLPGLDDQTKAQSSGSKQYVQREL